MKQLKKGWSFVLCLLLVFTLFIPVSAAQEGQTLNVYNWGVYMDLGGDDGAYYDEKASMDVNKAFESWYLQTYGESITVNYSNYENNEAMYQKLVAGGASYDIVIPSDYMVNRLIKEDRLEKLDFSQIPNYEFIDDLLSSTNSL